MQVKLELAKNGSYTCSVGTEEKNVLLYSKYSPESGIKIPVFERDNDIIVLGLGLGYEVASILKTTTGNIIVIDVDKTFYEIIENNKINHEILSNNRVSFIFGNEFINYNFANGHSDIYKINVLVKIHNAYFEKVLEVLNRKSNHNKKIVLIDYPIISVDICETYKTLGYEIIVLDIEDFKTMTLKIFELSPEYIFSVNFYPYLAAIAKTIKTKYISWTVDKPSYGLYTEEVLSEWNYIFHFEEKVVEQLKTFGVKNIYHLPLAANNERLEKITINEYDVQKYKADVSFVGTTISNNEINSLADKIPKTTLSKIDEIIKRQFDSHDKYIINELIDNDIVEDLYSTNLLLETEKYLTNHEVVSTLISRKYDEQYRTNLAASISNKFDFLVFGNDWQSINGKFLRNIDTVNYYNEMTKVFKLSKININTTRICFDSALPLRIFDILGAGGFLITDRKNGIEDLFVPGKHLVIYDDLDDLNNKIDFYLKNEKLREQIALEGYKLVKEKHTYNVRLKNIMNIVNGVN